MSIVTLRRQYHQRLCDEIIRVQAGKGGEYPNFADVGSKASIQFAWGILNAMEGQAGSGNVFGQTAGGRFETITRDFVEAAFQLLEHLRPGSWRYEICSSISAFDQYRHLAALEELIQGQTELQSVLGGEYIIRPDIVISRLPLADAEINQQGAGLTAEGPCARMTPLRAANDLNPRPILHASISCKWTIRSDRAQNTRAEALNLIRNRKGALPRIAAITAEPLPTRLAALALGTGDLDCVYHFALYELEQAVRASGNADQLEMLEIMTQGRRLRDISDLPFDLVI